MKTKDVLRAWGHILRGIAPALSIEITRECPLRCPGCYAYNDSHLGGEINLRQLSDLKGDALVQGVLEIVDREHPLHLSIVGGDPLVRYRELDAMLPAILARGVHVQVVTSAFRVIPKEWATWDHFTTVVSIDGLQPEHDERRKPATYDRILKNIADGKITIHSTITGQMMKRPGYLSEFLEFWTPRPEIEKVWFSVFTPQRGEMAPEVLTPEERVNLVQQLLDLRVRFPKLDARVGAIRELLNPPASPDDCIFAQTTKTISADLTTLITPCQFGGDPDCGQCGCIASMGLAAVGNHKLGGVIPVGSIFRASVKVGAMVSGRKPMSKPAASPAEFPILR